jgi:hypothetical protein
MRHKRELGWWQSLFDHHYERNGLQHPVVLSHCDGGPLNNDGAVSLYGLLESISVGFPWQAGDVMLLDNINTAHGRGPFTGQRDVQVAFIR